MKALTFVSLSNPVLHPCAKAIPKIPVSSTNKPGTHGCEVLSLNFLPVILKKWKFSGDYPNMSEKMLVFLDEFHLKNGVELFPHGNNQHL